MTENLVQRCSAIITRSSADGVEILVVQEASGMYNIPGGGQEPEDNFDLQATLKRELSEELCLSPSDYTIEDSDLVIQFAYENDNHPRFGQRGEIHGFVVNLKESADPKFSDDLIGMKWVKYRDAKDVIIYNDVHDLLNQVSEKYKIV